MQQQQQEDDDDDDDTMMFEACISEVWPRHHNFVQVYRKIHDECQIRNLDDLKTVCTTKVPNENDDDDEDRFIPVRIKKSVLLKKY